MKKTITVLCFVHVVVFSPGVHAVAKQDDTSKGGHVILDVRQDGHVVSDVSAKTAQIRKTNGPIIRKQDVSKLSGATKPAILSSAALKPTEDLHVVYQVACSAFSLHQAIALDWSWQQVKQPGKLTRIVCGCEGPEQEQRLQASVLEGHPDFAVFFARDWNQEVPKLFPQVSDDKYHAYNHPFGFKEWLEHSAPQADYILYMEPDMIFLEPILSHGAAPGVPVGERYSYVAAKAPADDPNPGWEAFMVPEVCGVDCPSIADIAPESFAVGPPTILHSSDWAKLVPLWTKYSVEVRARGHIHSVEGPSRFVPSWEKQGARPYIAEMLAYSLAAAVLRLPHKPTSLVADAGQPPTREKKIAHFCYPMEASGPDAQVWYWNKYRPPFGYKRESDQWSGHLLMNCEMPLFVEPPVGGGGRDRFWLIRKSIGTYNSAFLAFKEQRCHEQQLQRQKLILVDEDNWYILKSSIPKDDKQIMQLVEGTSNVKLNRTSIPSSLAGN